VARCSATCARRHADGDAAAVPRRRHDLLRAVRLHGRRRAC
jgi:hypothetical protein